MRPAILLRAAAVVIAVAGLVDAALTTSRATPRPLTITVIESPTLVLPDSAPDIARSFPGLPEGGPAITGRTRREAAWASAERLRSALADDFAISLVAQPADVSAAACANEGACVVISDGVRPRRMGTPHEVAGVKVGAELAPNVSLGLVATPARVDPAAIATLDATLTAIGIGEGRTALQVFDGPALVGQATHEWAAAPQARAVTADVRVEWTPLASGPRELRVVAIPMAREATALDNESRVGVNVEPMRAEVFIYEPEPSWAGTFVRRALESDPRLVVGARTRLGAAVSVSAGQGASLDAAALATAAVVVVSAPEQLTSTEVSVLERFIRARGGSVVLVPDQRPAGAIMRLIPGRIGERREAQPVAIGGLLSTELLTLDWPEIGTTVLASWDTRPVIASRAIGRGRLIVSGALDAWRFRGRDDAFARFWRALVADAAEAAGDALRVEIAPPLVRPDDELSVTVEWAGAEERRGPVEIGAVLICEGQPPAHVRLWPTGPAGRFAGTVAAAAPGVCRVEATLAAPVELKASAPLLVTSSVTSLWASADALTGAVAAHGGIVVAEGGESVLIARLRAQRSAAGVPHQMRPMRSPWWIVPFALCLGGEWWLRRRGGLR